VKFDSFMVLPPALRSHVAAVHSDKRNPQARVARNLYTQLALKTSFNG
jgi:hypothetical protein